MSKNAGKKFIPAGTPNFQSLQLCKPQGNLLFGHALVRIVANGFQFYKFSKFFDEDGGANLVLKINFFPSLFAVKGMIV
ncbi:MAG: hypothetical protein QW597_02720 [Thermoplasmataceae archaeon]